MEIFESCKEWSIKFLTSQSFLTATAVFIGYLCLFGFVKRIFKAIWGVFASIFGILNPFRFRRLCINGLSLIFMTASFALFAGTSAKMAGHEGRLEAIAGGSLAVGIWSIAMLIVGMLPRRKGLGSKPLPVKEKK